MKFGARERFIWTLVMSAKGGRGEGLLGLPRDVSPIGGPSRLFVLLSGISLPDSPSIEGKEKCR